MPLLDHFHPPLYPQRRWESFHSLWAAEIVAALNGAVLPEGYYAETQIHLGGRVEVDVATMEQPLSRSGPRNGPATLTAAPWAPPAPALVMPALFPDEIEVEVYGGATGAHLVGAIELVSPRNKDRPEARRAFAIKCACYLQMGVGLIVVDVVTDRLANLHNEMTQLLQQPEQYRLAGEGGPYVVAYRPARREGAGDEIDIWPLALAVGQPLSVMPLALRNGPTLPVDLEVTYTEARAKSRL